MDVLKNSIEHTKLFAAERGKELLVGLVGVLVSGPLIAFLGNTFGIWSVLSWGGYIATVAVPAVAAVLLFAIINLWLAPYRLLSIEIDAIREELRAANINASHALSEEDKFRAMVDPIINGLKQLENARQYHDAKPPDAKIEHRFAKRRLDGALPGLRERLLALGVNCPPLPNTGHDLNSWEHHLRNVLTLATEGDLASARNK